MKQISRRSLLAAAAGSVAAFGLSGCAANDEPDGEPLKKPLDRSRTLVTYFSVPLTDDPNADMDADEKNSTHIVDGKVLGNTQYVAQLIQEGTGGEVFRIETARELPLDYPVLEDQALKEQEAGARPKLAKLIPNLDDYDTVFVGYPIWWYDLPMPMYTFFEQHDFAGKTVIPFTTHGGSRLSGTVEKITGLLPDATVSENAFTISRDDMDSADSEVDGWLDSLTGK
ncbi:flavodoxin [Streptomyces umbrinus]|uniref:flavodoxin n=1 Tax=Streptomyces umbrinus TaxID=67370 RepID=UPI00343D3230